MYKYPKNFLKQVIHYLHPEATDFYRKVSQSVDYLASIQKDINDPESKFKSYLGSGYNTYVFEHHRDYKIWWKHTKKIYEKVSNYNDLLETNILFFEGLMPMTFYHLSPIYDMETSKLKHITRKLKFFTMEGQSS